MTKLEEKLQELGYFLGDNFVPFGREYRKKFTRYVDIVLFTNTPIEKIIDYRVENFLPFKHERNQQCVNKAEIEMQKDLEILKECEV